MDTTNYYFARAEIDYRQEQARHEVREARRNRRRTYRTPTRVWESEDQR